jgi:hypothetical protein
MTTLHDRLDDLADTVDVAQQGSDLDLWTLGRMQHRRRQAGAVLAGAAALVLAVGLGVLVGLPSSTDRTTPPADVPFGELHLPRTVYAPSAWAPGTDEAGPLGPVAAIGTATRAYPEGLTGEREQQSVFGVSAVDGSVRWLDLPEANLDDVGYGSLTVSPDGTKVGYVVTRQRSETTVPGSEILVEGWAVYDTVTGEALQLRDPEQPEIVGTGGFAIQFSGDSRYLQTNYSLIGSDTSRDDSLVIWDVETGDPTVVEGTGFYWLPSLGSAPTKIVWSRNEGTFSFDPATGETTTKPTTPRIVTWSDGPGSDSAYIDRGERNKDDWRLLSGDGRILPLDIHPGDLLWWRNAHTVVVPDSSSNVRFVDVRTGRTVGSFRLDVAPDDRDRVLLSPLYAGDLWANDLVDGVEPPDYADPRVNLSDVALVAVPAVLLGGAGLLLWRRRVRP